MRLFAIVATVNREGVSSTAQTIVESYLRQQLNQDQMNEYLTLFNEYLSVHLQNFEHSDSTKSRKRTSLNSVKVLLICNEINEVLQQKEKVIVILRLLEFINEDTQVNEKELEFVDTVAETFKISPTDYANIRAFILESPQNIPHKDKLLFVDNEEEFSDPQIKHIYNENLKGQIILIHISSANVFIFKYLGDETLYMAAHNIAPGWSYILSNGSVIKSPKITPIYYGDVAGKFINALSKTKIIFNASEVEFRFKNSENGIHKFNFCEESGRLIGIMGGSGVGKSTLLSIFNGSLSLNKGKITINGYDLHKDADKLEGVIGFVPQDDLLIEELTVFQNLYFNAKLCFNDFSEKKILRSVVRVLQDLDLNEIKHLTVGDPLNKFISGGQRKRLNIALELIREPSILIVDEPTSGLSSMDSEIVMTLLKEQTLKGKLVIVNIHQPSSDIYKLFDKLLILDKGGYPVYYGNPIDAVVYFKTMGNFVNAHESECVTCGNVNSEQVLQIIESRIVNEYGKFTRNRKFAPKELYESYQTKIESKLTFPSPDVKYELPHNYFKIPTRFKQFKIFSFRNVLSKLTNTQFLLINFLESPLLAFILGYFSKFIKGTTANPDQYLFCENENIPAYLFMAVVVSLFLGMTVSAEEIIRDRKILKREKFLNLSWASYLNAKIIVLFFISAIQTISFILVGNLILGIKGMTFSYWAILFTTSCFANIVGLNISAALNSVVTIYILIPFILVPQLLLSGTIVSFDKLHKNLTSPLYVPMVGDMMISRWAYEALMVVQFKNNRYTEHFYEVNKKLSEIDYRSWVLSRLSEKIDFCEKNLKEKTKREQVTKNFRMLRNEINVLLEHSPKVSFEKVDSIQFKHFNANLIVELRSYFEQLQVYYTALRYKINLEKDKIQKDLEKQFGSNELVTQFKIDYQNDRIGDLLLNKLAVGEGRGIEVDDIIVQNTDLIYMEPRTSYGRAHFYAPVKRIGKLDIDTFWFNALVIWLATATLYTTLLFDMIRKVLDYLGSLIAKILKKRRD